MKKAVKRIAAVIVCLFLLIIITAAAALILNKRKTYRINDDFSSVFSDTRYSKAVGVNSIDVIKQDISCGYAVIEMFSAWSGGSITEETLYDEYGKVVTSTGESFCREMNKQFPQYETVMHKYLTNTELIDTVYNSLSKGIPVPVEWAALYEGEWTLHYSLITEMDISNNKVTVANPYGYYEELTAEELLSRTRYDAFEDMPLFLKLGFAFGIFEKNTVFTVE